MGEKHAIVYLFPYYLSWFLPLELFPTIFLLLSRTCYVCRYVRTSINVHCVSMPDWASSSLTPPPASPTNQWTSGTRARSLAWTQRVEGQLICKGTLSSGSCVEATFPPPG